jgi:hypothetical protein
MQNYNNILHYIKSNLGFLNQIELSNEDIFEYIKEHSLTELSLFDPRKKVVKISKEQLTDHEFEQYCYVIPISEDEDILSILDVATNINGMNRRVYDVYTNVLSNVQESMLASLTDHQTYRLIYKSKETGYKYMISFYKELLEDVYVTLGLKHLELSTISPDVYNLYFKDLCLRDIINMLIANRSKFEELGTNNASIRLNMNFLEQKKSDLDRKLDEAKQDFLLDTGLYISWIP